jgi:hypothetical protein
MEFCRRLGDSWSELVMVLEMPEYDRKRLTAGHEAAGIWAWLQARGRLDELPVALRRIGRNELADLITTAHVARRPNPAVRGKRRVNGALGRGIALITVIVIGVAIFVLLRVLPPRNSQVIEPPVATFPSAERGIFPPTKQPSSATPSPTATATCLRQPALNGIPEKTSTDIKVTIIPGCRPTQGIRRLVIYEIHDLNSGTDNPRFHEWIQLGNFDASVEVRNFDGTIVWCTFYIADFSEEEYGIFKRSQDRKAGSTTMPGSIRSEQYHVNRLYR